MSMTVTEFKLYLYKKGYLKKLEMIPITIYIGLQQFLSRYVRVFRHTAAALVSLRIKH